MRARKLAARRTPERTGPLVPVSVAEELNAHRANPSRVARLAEARRRQEGESYDYAGVGIETLPGGGLLWQDWPIDSFKPTNGMVKRQRGQVAP